VIAEKDGEKWRTTICGSTARAKVVPNYSSKTNLPPICTDTLASHFLGGSLA